MAELIAKSASAVAVDDSLTTLIDWVNIELASGFTVIVQNVGGGSGNDISDVQIDTSTDGGTTVSLDQHADTPAVPITSGNAPSETFTETANFVRVRAVCAEGEDTTALAFLLADSAAGRICTIADIKDRLGLTGTDYDTVLSRIVRNLESQFNSYCNRELILNASAVTEYYGSNGSRYLQLNRYPIAAITSIKQSYDFDFDNTDALTANTDYRLVKDGKTGIVYRLYNGWYYPDREDTIQVVYRGGYCAAGVAAGSGETELPDDLREAAIEQASFIFKRRDDIGLTGVSFEGGSISKFSALKLLPNVEAILNKYRKVQL